MVEEYAGKPQGYQTMLISRFMELVVLLSRQYENQGDSLQSSLMHLASAISYIEDHYMETFTLKDVAAQSGISVRHLNRIFQSYYQTTPISYLQKLRLEQACSLLRSTNLPITRVSYECGFSDSNYFARQFNKAYGMTPKAYRRQR